jgi:hypothetical protein
MRTIIIKNISDSTRTWCLTEFAPNDEVMLDSEAKAESFYTNIYFMHDLYEGYAAIGDGDKFFSDIIEAVQWLKNETIKTVVSQTPAFPAPDYCLKHNAIAATECEPNESVNCDYCVSSERYIFGGEGLIENAEVGDYFTACIYDKDSVLPEEMRSEVEDWPIVSTYVEKQWIMTSKVDHARLVCHCPLLAAKISGGLYVRITYTAANSGTTRKILSNLFLAKKL